MTPIIKWAGGKTQLLQEIDKRLPTNPEDKIYIEPFLGAGSVFFYMFDKGFKKYILNDINSNLINMYIQVKKNHKLLMKRLDDLQEEYNNFDTIQEKEKMYYIKRKQYNSSNDLLINASLFIF